MIRVEVIVFHLRYRRVFKRTHVISVNRLNLEIRGIQRIHKRIMESCYALLDELPEEISDNKAVFASRVGSAVKWSLVDIQGDNWFKRRK